MINECTSEQIENGWTRIAVTFTPSVAGTYTLAGCTDWIYGTSSFDDLQLEKGSAASSYNYLINGDAEWADGWSFSAGASRAALTAIHGSYAVKITGDMKTKRTASITVPLNISSDTTLVLSGWAQATSAADIAKDKSSERAFGLEAVLTYSDNTTETHYVSFDGSSSHLQYTSLNIVPKKTGSTIKNAVIRCVYGKNANTAYFDNISLKKRTSCLL